MPEGKGTRGTGLGKHQPSLKTGLAPRTRAHPLLNRQSVRCWFSDVLMSPARRTREAFSAKSALWERSKGPVSRMPPGMKSAGAGETRRRATLPVGMPKEVSSALRFVESKCVLS